MGDLDGEIGRERPEEGIMGGRALSGGVIGGVEEERGHSEGAIDEIVIGMGGGGEEEPVEGEVEGEGGEFGEGEEGLQEIIHVAEVWKCRVRALGGTGSLRHR